MGVSLQPLTMAHFGTLCVLLLGCMAHYQAVRSSHSGDLARTSKLSLLKETSNKIEHGPEYVSHHKDDKQDMFNHKGAIKHNSKARYTKKSKLARQQPANTRYDRDNIHLQRLDHQPITRKKKMDKMYKKMIEKEKLRLKKKHFKKMQKKQVIT